VGIVAAALVGQLTSGLLFDVPALDVTTFALVPLLFLTAAFVAAYRPGALHASIRRSPCGRCKRRRGRRGILVGWLR
jgi:hypothetical protein